MSVFDQISEFLLQNSNDRFRCKADIQPIFSDAYVETTTRL